MEYATILMRPSTCLSGILLSVRTQYPWRTRIWKKYQHYIHVREKFYQLHAAQRQLLRPLNNLEKTGPSEIERIHNIRKQQTRFYWVFSWELMKSAIIFTPPSTGLRGFCFLKPEASSTMRALLGARWTYARLYTLRIEIGTRTTSARERPHCWTRLWLEIILLVPSCF